MLVSRLLNGRLRSDTNRKVYPPERYVFGLMLFLHLLRGGKVLAMLGLLLRSAYLITVSQPL
jgi:hypothetical protein